MKNLKTLFVLVLAFPALVALAKAQDDTGIAFDEYLESDTTIDLTEEPVFKMTLTDQFLEAVEFGGLWVDDGEGGLVAAGEEDHTVFALLTDGTATLVLAPSGCQATWVATDESTETEPFSEFSGLSLQMGSMLEEEDDGPGGDDPDGSDAAVEDMKEFLIPVNMIIWPLQLGACWKKKAGTKVEYCKTNDSQCSIIVFTTLGMFGGKGDCDGKSFIRKQKADDADVLYGTFPTVVDPYQ